MKNNPQEYAEMLIYKYSSLNFRILEEYLPIPKTVIIDIAIVDATNTIEALENTGEFLPFDTNYFNEVLTILKSKL